MPQSNEGILLLIGALFLLLGLLGGGFEVSAIKIPPVGKYTRAFAFVIGTLVFGVGIFRLLFGSPLPASVALTPPTALPTPTSFPASPPPVIPTNTPPPTLTTAPTKLPLPTDTPIPPSTELSPQTPEGTRLPPTAKIQNIYVDYDQTRFEKKGMVIHINFNITGMHNVECRATAYFAQRAGKALQDTNDEYNTIDGQVSTGESFTPGYEITQYDDLQLFMPYDELELSPGSYELKFHVELWEQAHPENKALAVSPDINFDYTE